VLLILGLAVPITAVALADWRLFSRALTYPEQPIMAMDWYQPLASIAGNPGPALPEAEVTPVIAPDALAAASTYAAENQSTGLLVLHQGQVVWEEYWQGYGPSDRFNAMSMTKTLVGLLVGIAIAEGHIDSVTDPVATYLPEWRHDARADITLLDLLYMQSGLRNEDSTHSPFSDLVQMYVGSRVNQTALRVPSQQPPGAAYSYNNVNTQILSIVLERATGEPFQAYLASRLWQPLQAEPAHIWLDRPGGNPKAFCCFFATLRDWGRVGQLLLNRGRVGDRQVVPADWIKAMLTASPIESTYGLHIWLKARTPAHPNVDTAASVPFIVETFHMDGRGLQRVYVIPSRDLVIVRMGEDAPQWDDAVIPNLLAAGSAPVTD
jgi:CubicO group peptidase (beta-lactamase class C family)